MSLYLSFRHRRSKAGGHSACKTYGAVRRGHSSKREHVSPLIGSGPSGILPPEACPGCDSHRHHVNSRYPLQHLEQKSAQFRRSAVGGQARAMTSPLTPSLFDGDAPEPTPPAWSMGREVETQGGRRSEGGPDGSDRRAARERDTERAPTPMLSSITQSGVGGRRSSPCCRSASRRSSSAIHRSVWASCCSCTLLRKRSMTRRDGISDISSILVGVEPGARSAYPCHAGSGPAASPAGGATKIA